MKLGIIKERKSPPDRRVVLCPKQVKKALDKYNELSIKIEHSDIRIFKDENYASEGLVLSSDMTDCDVLLGVKEIPVDYLIPNKTYVFFSHTIKKQEHNRKLLQACLDKNITLMDHETFVDGKNTRIIGFGRYAGIVGAYNTLRGFGLKYELFELAKAETLLHKEDLIYRLKKQYFPPIKIVVTGTGKVAHGIMEILDGMKMKKVSKDHFLTQKYDRPVYTQIGVEDYYKRIDGTEGNKQDFYDHPELYTSDFERFTRVADILMTGHFFKKGAPVILTKEMLNSPFNQIKVIGDISCDVDHGPIASTLKASTIAEPFYGYHPGKGTEVEFDHPAAITVMAIDNLPCELPKDASEGFGEVFVEQVLPAFFNGDKDKILARATITKGGKLTDRFNYLQDFVDGKE
ncbi:alanine dehydrogenase [Myroides odoratimimus]|uniref:NAD(P)-dependent oxidoreductase n=1 Tax=Myroides odoratimimus TaxID=76832 RepID=UPI002576DF99|nr:NAD(P)-dependent oxidoreductase [Myroides odoratimimus]MDM1098269.1 alanine dehydrogenase [Myroides odoratimimus]MDM1328110.1 alanine dehydrogenase [Myroides odoratimimus]MDM1444696.1 alanine dehydrogenase [Myroides odoratimimus]MDM1451312.1 alanine dehydrogenase [Myroides odoratimimus]MDM1454389.1 alanine dehydrogenase [Myroides odoratimimus]